MEINLRRTTEGRWIGRHGLDEAGGPTPNRVVDKLEAMRKNRLPEVTAYHPPAVDWAKPLMAMPSRSPVRLIELYPGSDKFVQYAIVRWLTAAEQELTAVVNGRGHRLWGSYNREDCRPGEPLVVNAPSGSWATETPCAVCTFVGSLEGAFLRVHQVIQGVLAAGMRVTATDMRAALLDRSTPAGWWVSPQGGRGPERVPPRLMIAYYPKKEN